VQQCQRIGLVVVGRLVAAAPDRGDDVLLASIALACGVPLDRAHGHALVRNLVVLAPGGEVRHESAVGMSSVHAGVAADLLEEHGTDHVRRLLDLGEPPLETQIAHATALKAMRLEGLGSAGHCVVAAAEGPPGLRSQVQRQDRVRCLSTTPVSWTEG
jgi:hypothetical protein